MKNVHISDGGADKAHIEEEGGRERSSREGNWEMRTLCHRVNNSGGIRKWSKDLGGGDEGVIKGGIQRADADGFGTNGCLKVTDCGRLPGGSMARAEMRGEREHLAAGSGMR